MPCLGMTAHEAAGSIAAAAVAAISSPGDITAAALPHKTKHQQERRQVVPRTLCQRAVELFTV